MFADCPSGVNWNRCGFCGQSQCRGSSGGQSSSGGTPKEQSAGSDEKGFGSKFLDGLQFAFDIVGFIPGVGEFFDLGNGVIYGARGDNVNAALSFASAIPFAGWCSSISKFFNKGSDIVRNGGRVFNNLTDEISEWLGRNTRVITNANGDKVFISADGTRRVRFDINNPSPHNNPHGHIEELVNGKWQKSGPIYPYDVPHN